MIKEIELINWKSFDNSKFYIDPLTFLIGINASGKSNILDALEFLCNCAKGIYVNEVAQKVRGGADWIVRKGFDSYTLKATIETTDGDLIYSITCQKVQKQIRVVRESLILHCLNSQTSKNVFQTEMSSVDSDANVVTICLFNQGKDDAYQRIELSRHVCALAQMENLISNDYVKQASLKALNALKGVFVLNPIPNHMRDYSPLSVKLNSDAGNLAGLLAAMNPSEKERIEAEVTKYVRPLPEKDIRKIWTETVGRFSSDAMLYCEEEWMAGETVEIDARSMSDGTLRFVAIVAAILTGEPGSLLVIEEVDNGLHPSRAQELVKVLKDLGERTGVDVICTTHNPVLVDKLGRKMIPFISYVSRSPENGCSKVFLLEDKENLLKLMAQGSVGSLMVEDAI